MNQPLFDIVLCGAHVFAFSEVIAKEHRADLLHSNLLAQLASDKKYAERSEPWYNDYKRNLGRLGWVTTLSQTRSASPDADADAPVVLMDAVAAELKRFVAPAEAAAGMALLSTLSQLSAFTAAVDGKILRRDVAPADESSVTDITEESPIEPADKQVINRLSLTLIMVTSERSQHTLSVDCDTLNDPGAPLVQHGFSPSLLCSDVQVHHSVTLLSNRYDTLRDGVIAKLGDKTQALIIPQH